MVKVLIQDGKVHEIFGENAPELHPALLVVDAPNDVEIGWSYIDGSFSAPAVITETELKAAEERMWRDSELQRADIELFKVQGKGS